MDDTATRPGPLRRWRFGVAAAALLLGLMAAVAIGESLGWPFLAAPLQRWLSDTLDRRVRFADDADTQASRVEGFRIRFVGGVRLATPLLEIAAPAWSSAPHLLLVRDAGLEMRYTDLWRAYRGQPLRIELLRAATLDGQLERLADGRVSWQFGPVRPPTAPPEQPVPVPSFGKLQVAAGTLHYLDVPLAIDVQVRLSLVDRASALAPAGAVSPAVPARVTPDSVLRVDADGHYRKLPVRVELVSSGVMPWAADASQVVPVPLTLHGTVGGAVLDIKGSALDALHLKRLAGHFSLSGPSLAAVGDPVGVTLPTTGPFRSSGVVVKQGTTWSLRIDDATVGASRLNGAFTYETRRSVPMLAGRLGGSRLLLADLGPVVGKTPAVAASTTAAEKMSAPAALIAPPRGRGRVLPGRPFDLAALRAMDANVLIDIREVDLNTAVLEPLRPLRGHLQLTGGVLTLRDLDARTGQGRLRGDLALDGRASTALWTSDLLWDGVRLESWLHQRRATASPPFVSGRLNGRATLAGRGRSTAEILASLKGQVRAEVVGGTVSHVAIEVAGLDLAQALGVQLRGDDMLPLQCAVVDLVADGGVFRPRVMVLDTKDSVILVDGSLSLATETMDLRAVVSPKDFSPLALRTPLHLRGSFAQPTFSFEKRPVALKLAGSFLLALVNPLAALLPLIDPGSADAAARGAAGCQALMQRVKARAVTVAPRR